MVQAADRYNTLDILAIKYSELNRAALRNFVNIIIVLARKFRYLFRRYRYIALRDADDGVMLPMKDR